MYTRVDEPRAATTVPRSPHTELALDRLRQRRLEIGGRDELGEGRGGGRARTLAEVRDRAARVDQPTARVHPAMAVIRAIDSRGQSCCHDSSRSSAAAPGPTRPSKLQPSTLRP